MLQVLVIVSVGVSLLQFYVCVDSLDSPHFFVGVFLRGWVFPMVLLSPCLCLSRLRPSIDMTISIMARGILVCLGGHNISFISALFV